MDSISVWLYRTTQSSPRGCLWIIWVRKCKCTVVHFSIHAHYPNNSFIQTDATYILVSFTYVTFPSSFLVNRSHHQNACHCWTAVTHAINRKSWIQYLHTLFSIFHEKKKKKSDTGGSRSTVTTHKSYSARSWKLKFARTHELKLKYWYTAGLGRHTYTFSYEQ